MRPLATVITAILLLSLPTAAARANANDDRIVSDCQHSASGSLSGSYPKAQLNHALHNLPGDVREYTGCYDAIRQALLAGGGGNGGGNPSGGGPGGFDGAFGGGGGSTDGTAGAGGGAGATIPSTPPPPGAEKPVEVAGVAVAPGSLPEIGRDSHRLPTALIVLLALLGVAALAPATLTIGRRVIAARRA